jgi:malate dehydrogenase
MKQKKVIKVAVTGGGGQIAYNLLFRIAAGELLGQDQPLFLAIHDLPEQIETNLKGVLMELEDGLYPLLQKVVCSSNLHEIFNEADLVILLGSKPRGPGMERRDLLHGNGTIFQLQGKVLNEVALKETLVFVVGNPCNTNCLIAMSNAPNIPRKNFHAMTRLDQNRALFQLAKKAHVPLQEVKNVTIWGNHSSTQVADFLNANISGVSLTDKITDIEWLKNDFLKIIQQRGAEIIKARGKSSAASAAQAIIDAIKDLMKKSESDKWFSSAICTDNNPYGIKEGLIFSFPCQSDGLGKIKIVSDLSLDNFLKEKIIISEKELIEERELIKHLLG